jgi:hypothetical protein
VPPLTGTLIATKSRWSMWEGSDAQWRERTGTELHVQTAYLINLGSKLGDESLWRSK